MTNNQRFAAELGILLVIGASVWAKADSKQQPATDVQPSVVTREVIVVDADGKPRARLTSAGLDLIDKKPLIGNVGKITAHFGDPIDGKSDGATLEIMGSDNMSSIALGEYTNNDVQAMMLSLGAPENRREYPNGTVNLYTSGAKSGGLHIAGGADQEAEIRTFPGGGSEVKASTFTKK